MMIIQKVQLHLLIGITRIIFILIWDSIPKVDGKNEIYKSPQMRRFIEKFFTRTFGTKHQPSSFQMNYQTKRAYYFNKYPALEDLERRAYRRMPFVAQEYLRTGTSREELVARNKAAFARVNFCPKFCKGPLSPKLATQVLGQDFSLPFGMAPVGLTGLMWPKAEIMLAQVAKAYEIPFSLSTAATETPEALAPHIGDFGWFQLYTPKDKNLAKDLLHRAQKAGFTTLLITADVPTPSRRERMTRAGLQLPPKITPYLLWQGMTHPTWSVHTLKRGLPRLRTVESYAGQNSLKSVDEFIHFEFGGNLSWDYVAFLRDHWDGPVVLKGILHPEDAEKAVELGLDGVVVSNHGGRQFDGAMTSIEALPAIVQAVKGKTAIIFDSGVRSGLDIMRALALGAEFVMLGRPFLYGITALGVNGGAHVVELLKEDLKVNMIQLGVESLEELFNSHIANEA